MNKKKKLARIVFALNAFLFIMGGISLIGEHKLVFGVIQIIAGLFNAAMVPDYKQSNLKEKLNYLILLMNVVVCLTVAIDNIQMGKNYIQFVWLIAALMSLAAMVIQYRNKGLSNQT